MTSEQSNPTPAQVPESTLPSSSQANMAHPLPAVGDLSKLSEATAGLEPTLTKTVPPAPKPPQPSIVVSTKTTGVPFAASQSIVPEAIPAALAAKNAAEAAKKAEAKGLNATTPDADNTAIQVSEGNHSEGHNSESNNTVGPATTESTAPALEGHHAPQVRFKNEQGKLLLILPSETNDSSGSGTLSYAWPEIMTQLRQRLQTEARNWEANTAVHLITRDRLLNAQQLQEIVEALALSKLQLRRVYTSRRQTAITASTAGYSVEQHVAVTNLNPAPAEAGEAMAEPLVLKATLRSGAEIRHNGTVVVIGDANPGSAIVAEGDIVVWGRLRGTAHAGSKGNSRSRIMALQMEPAQIRIADFVARGPSTMPSQFFPELAYVTPQGAISIARVSEFKESAPSNNPSRPTAGRKLPATGKQI